MSPIQQRDAVIAGLRKSNYELRRELSRLSKALHIMGDLCYELQTNNELMSRFHREYRALERQRRAFWRQE